ncbi:MAG: amidohydrolase family protein, partial [Gammaproteobacteria bacterium]|nr:amidohydrolase family protein [Gammaproteobacteria bacterium]
MVLRIFFVCLFFSAPVSVLIAAPTADLILTNARIYTADTKAPWATAIAITGEHILAVGSSAEIDPMRDADTLMIDLEGAFASPGFNDGHVHIDSTGQLITGVNLLDIHDPVGFVERIRGAAERLPEGSWIIRGSWGAYEQWEVSSSGTEPRENQPKGPFTPDRRLIDPITPEHPVLISRFDRSMYLANTRALELAGITANTPEPRDGRIEKDADGRLTGILRGGAVALVEQIIPPISFEQRLVQVRAVLKEARESGVTTMQDLTNAAQLRAYQALKERGELTARIM